MPRGSWCPIAMTMASPPGLLCGFYHAQDAFERDWLQLTAALAAPLLSRLREQRHQQQLDRLEALQGLLGTGWWELPNLSDDIQLAPQLQQHLNPDEATTRHTLSDWLRLLHPADREELASRLQRLADPEQTAVDQRAPAPSSTPRKTPSGIASKARPWGSATIGAWSASCSTSATSKTSNSKPPPPTPGWTT